MCGIWWKRIRHDVINKWVAITKLIVTTSREIFGATDSTEGKHFKGEFQYLSILLKSIIFKLLPFSIFHAEYYTN